MHRVGVVVRLGFVVLGGVGVAAACGVESIELFPTSSAPLLDGGTDAAGSSPGPGGAGARDLPTCDVTVPPIACRPLGDACGSASDCCSLRCEAGTCLASDGGAPGVSCASRGECASGLCEPAGARNARVCLPMCRPAGAACQRASDCCAFACNGGLCGGPACVREGKPCTTAAQCCSNKCDKGKCALERGTPCRATGEKCGAGENGDCCGVCETTSQACDLGPGPCRLPGTLCVASTECCEGECLADSFGNRVCTATCLEQGAECRASFECCSGACTGNPPRCGPAPSPCTRSGAPCAGDAECCSGSCADGACQPSCVPPIR